LYTAAETPRVVYIAAQKDRLLAAVRTDSVISYCSELFQFMAIFLTTRDTAWYNFRRVCESVCLSAFVSVCMSVCMYVLSKA